MDAPFFSVIVPTIGRTAGLVALIDALERQTLPEGDFETIIVADGIQLSSEVHAAIRRIGGRLVELESRRGPGAARNQGAALARGEYLAFTEDDIVPGDDWLLAANARLGSNALDVLEGATELPDGSSARRRSPGGFSFIPTNLFIRKSMFVRADGYCELYFDERRSLYFREDSDFGFSLAACNARMEREAASVVVHPFEHAGFWDPISWARRYEMDPLLRTRHPARFRQEIEAHRIGRFTIRRPFVRASGVFVSAFVLVLAGAHSPGAWTRAAGLVAMAGSLLTIWAKWHFALRRLPLVPVVPFVMVRALVIGRMRTRRIVPRWA